MAQQQNKMRETCMWFLGNKKCAKCSMCSYVLRIIIPEGTKHRENSAEVVKIRPDFPKQQALQGCQLFCVYFNGQQNC